MPHPLVPPLRGLGSALGSLGSELLFEPIASERELRRAASPQVALQHVSVHGTAPAPPSMHGGGALGGQLSSDGSPLDAALAAAHAARLAAPARTSSPVGAPKVPTSSSPPSLAAAKHTQSLASLSPFAALPLIGVATVSGGGSPSSPGSGGGGGALLAPKPNPSPLARFASSSGLPLTGLPATAKRPRPPDCRCTPDDTLEGLSLLFLAGCRPVYALLTQCVVFSLGVFLLRDPAAYATSARHWPSWVAVADVASLGSIALALRSEGASLKALLYPADAVSAPLHKEVTLAVGYYMVLFGAQAAGELAAGCAVYGWAAGAPDAAVLPATLALGKREWSLLLTLLVFPALFALGEVATYVSLLFPRAERLFGSYAACALVALAWAAEAAFLPLVLDARHTALRVLSSLAVCGATLHLYRLHRRVLPLAIAHWALMTVAAVSSAARGL